MHPGLRRDVCVFQWTFGTRGVKVEDRIRQAYHLGLELADAERRRVAAAGEGDSRPEDKGEVFEPGEEQPGSFPKSRPATKSEAGSPPVAPAETKEKEKAPPAKEGKKKDKKKRRSRSPKRKPKREEEHPRIEEREPSRVKEEENSPEPLPRRIERKTRERETHSPRRPVSPRRRSPPRSRTRSREAARGSRGSPVRPRSPPGPPPPRADPAERWQGPIPGRWSRVELAEAPPRHPEASNKGVALRPAARVRGLAVRAKAKAKAAAKPAAKAKQRAGRALRRRPAARGEEAAEDELGDKEISEAFKAGQVVQAVRVPLYPWRAGQKVVGVDCTYWEEPTKIAGTLKGVDVEGDEVHLKLAPEGTQSEALVKWVGQNPGVLIDLHLCRDDCAKLSKDGLVHCRTVKGTKEGEKEVWMENLLGMGGPEPEIDELERLRQRKRELEKRDPAPEGRPPGEAGQVGSQSSEDTKEKRKKKKKRQKKEKKDENKVRGADPKSLEAVFAGTGLDPSPTKRKVIKKKARRAAKRKLRKDASSSSSSGSSLGGDSTSSGEPGRLFGEEARVKTVWKRFPGTLTLNTAEMMQSALVMQSGQPWSLDRAQVPPIFSQYWRMYLHGRMSAPMAREAQTLSYIVDLLVQARVASATDVATQRLKALEQMAAGGHFSIAQRQELVPIESTMLSSPIETMDASKLHREEQKARSAASKQWERRPEWEKRNEDSKGKGKTKDNKGKGKTKTEGAPPHMGGKEDGRAKK
eukprot:s785_g3.t1